MKYVHKNRFGSFTLQTTPVDSPDLTSPRKLERYVQQSHHPILVESGLLDDYNLEKTVLQARIDQRRQERFSHDQEQDNVRGAFRHAGHIEAYAISYKNIDEHDRAYHNAMTLPHAIFKALGHAPKSPILQRAYLLPRKDITDMHQSALTMLYASLPYLESKGEITVAVPESTHDNTEEDFASLLSYRKYLRSMSMERLCEIEMLKAFGTRKFDEKAALFAATMQKTDLDRLVENDLLIREETDAYQEGYQYRIPFPALLAIATI